MRYEPKKPTLMEFKDIDTGLEFEADGLLYKKIPLVGEAVTYYDAVCLNCRESSVQILRKFPDDRLVRPVAGSLKEV